MSQLDVRRSFQNGSGPQIVFVHGAMDRASNFARVGREIRDRDVVLYTRRGYQGSADLPPEVEIDLHVADLIEVLDGRPSVLIGHSFGSLVALAAATQAPTLTESVGIYEPPLPWLDWWPTEIEYEDEATAAKTFFDKIVGPDVWKGLPPHIQDARRSEGRAVMTDFASASAGPPFDVADLMSPVGVAYGSRTAPHFKASAVAMVELLHDAKLSVIADAHHGAHMSHPARFAQWAKDVADLSRR